MPDPLRLLVLEDDPVDAELMVHALEQAGFAPLWDRVEDADEFVARLDPVLDVILADYTLPAFDARRALELLQERGLDVPFVVVTGTASEEAAVDCIKRGATDYLLKDRLNRLGEAVRRALADRELRAAKRRAEAALRESEERLRQAQKMEAIGRLAGGVAHDFNNMLGLVIGYGEFLAKGVRNDPVLSEYVGEIRDAAERAAALTQQLLALSRRQVLEPRVLHLNEAVGETERMLRRLIGEDVELVARFDPATPRVKVDPGSLVQVLLNLAVNARDAMPSGGRLTIATAAARVDAAAGHRLGLVPGMYALLSVTDTGSGMDRATLDRIFEPFFTTRESGKGTGLGLATVYGIVAQSGGAIDVRTALGAGSCFMVYLPETGEPAADTPSQSEALPAGGTETILLVEDEARIRTLTAHVLEAAGYHVLVAADGHEAFQLARECRGGIDLLVTDVVMPGPSGHEVATELKKYLPGLKVLYVSGYPEEEVLRRGVAEGTATLLRKPFVAAQLLRHVRGQLTERRRRP